MLLLGEIGVTVGAPVAFVHGLPQTRLVDREGKRFSVDGHAELLLVTGETVLRGSELFFLGRDFSDGMGTMAF